MENAQTLPAVRGESREMALAISPDLKLEQGRKAAVALKRMISETRSSIKIGQSEHVKAEAWQTVGSFFNVTVKTEVEACEIDGIKGAKASATLIDDSNGQIVGGGEAYCMRDEPNWARKPWMQLASMAQTRAASRGLSNKYKWITVMAGFSPTPAEEMDGHEYHAPAKSKAAVSKPTADTPVDEPTMAFESAKLITEVQEMLGTMNGGDEELMNRQLHLLTKWNDKSTKEEKFLQLKDLPGIGQHKPDWLKGVHKKVAEEYQKALDAQGNTK